ncbi:MULTISPECIES: hypothetical protein [unclassified Microcoleus]|uniref:hypothetical protein n=1 Tax=unclassified Microcoleus TaxID=2642155 RepID=UPI002FD17FBE
MISSILSPLISPVLLTATPEKLPASVPLRTKPLLPESLSSLRLLMLMLTVAACICLPSVRR